MAVCSIISAQAVKIMYDFIVRITGNFLICPIMNAFFLNNGNIKNHQNYISKSLSKNRLNAIAKGINPGKLAHVPKALPKQALLFTCLHYKSFENTVGISPFSTVLTTNMKNFLPFSSNLKFSSADSIS